MSNRSEKEKQKQTQEKCQVILCQLLREEDNKYCVDCDAKGPRWASWNLGIFLCIRCAGIHRNLGVHISRVKSVNLDTWTPEQVACLQQMGNSKARAVYEANLPDNFRRPQTDSSLEAFIRAKYEQKKYIAKEWVQPPMPKPAFNIEEENRKEREKKRRSKGIPNADIPTLQQPSALPRPHSTAPSVSGGSPSSIKSKENPSLQENCHQKTNSSSTVDLLGLDAPSENSTATTTDDPFDSFMSAAPVTTTATTNNSQFTADSDSSLSSQNEQSAEILKRNVLSKESILSLYGNTNPAPPPQQMFGIPGGMYLGQQVYIPQPVNWQGAVLPEGVMGQALHSNSQSANNMPTTNPFLAMTVPGLHNHQQSALLMDPSNNMVLAGQMPTGLGQVQQQMASLNLGNQMPNVMMFQNSQQAPGNFIRPTGHTLSTNLWQ